MLPESSVVTPRRRSLKALPTKPAQVNVPSEPILEMEPSHPPYPVTSVSPQDDVHPPAIGW